MFTRIAVVAALAVLTACQPNPRPQPPVATVKPEKLEIHGHIRIDNYYWLKERENPEVIAYLEAENQYTDMIMAPTEELQSELFSEIKARIKQTDSSVPYRLGDYYYYHRFKEGQQYPVYCRRKGSLEAAEEAMIDANALALDSEYFAVRDLEVNENQDILAYSTDRAGRRIYTLHFKDLKTGDLLEDVIPQVTGEILWANDNRTLFYTKQDLETLRPYQVYRHILGTDPATDELIYEEEDETFEVYLSKTKSQRYILLESSQTLSTEVRYLRSDDPLGSFRLLEPREVNHEYHVEHVRDSFYILTNHEAPNFRLIKTPVARPSRANWEEVIPHRSNVFLEDLEVFLDYLVLLEREAGLLKVRVRPWSQTEDHYIDFPEPAYKVYPENNLEFDTPLLRYRYSSMNTPDSIFDYNMETQMSKLLKQEEVLGGYSSANYQTLRLQAKATDGTSVPISVVYRKDRFRNGANPLLLYGYGSYGSSLDADFSPPRVSLLNRGFVFAIAHIRGGQELGRQWYEDGKLLKKKNSFTDFISCAEHLIKEGYSAPDLLFAQGGSAGGLLVGAVTNMRPDLFKGVIAEVPWVDVVTTMLDPDIPLTTSEFDEWGNPSQVDYYEYMLSYSPYDNVEARDYPHLLVTTGFQDSQVQYWEPAKWVAKLRALKTNDNLLLLRTNFKAGHGGPSGRYRKYRETAFQYAFLLMLAGIET